MSYDYDESLSYARGLTDVTAVLLAGQNTWTLIIPGTLTYQPRGNWMGQPMPTFSFRVRVLSNETREVQGPTSSIVAVRRNPHQNAQRTPAP